MIRAKTIMNANPPVLQATDTMQQAAKKLVAKNAKIGLIFNRGGFMGIITEEMIFSEVIINRKVGPHTQVGNLARRDFSPVDAKTPFSRIEKGFRENQKSRFVVMEHGTPVGIITEFEHVAALRNFTHYHYIMQDVILALFGVTTTFFLFYFSPWGELLRLR